MDGIMSEEEYKKSSGYIKLQEDLMEIDNNARFALGVGAVISILALAAIGYILSLGGM